MVSRDYPRGHQLHRGPKDHVTIRPARAPVNPHIPNFINPDLRLRPTYYWSNWDELTVVVKGLKSNETTYNLYRNFCTQGSIAYIDIREYNGVRDGTARIRYCPVPATPFWDDQRGRYHVAAIDDSRYFVFLFLSHRDERSMIVPSPIRRHIFYPLLMRMYADKLHFGIMVDRETIMPLRTLQPYRTNGLSFCVNLRQHRITATFQVEYIDDGSTSHMAGYEPNKYDRINQYRFEIPFSQLKTIRRVEISRGVFGLLISLDSPPQYYRKRMDAKACHSSEGMQWNEFDTWYRQTDLIYDPYQLHRAVVTLHKERPIIDIGKTLVIRLTSFILTHVLSGRWTTYLFEFSHCRDETKLFEKIREVLQDYNIDVLPMSSLNREPARAADMWAMIDATHLGGASTQLSSLAGAVALPFEVRYQLEVCISRGVINEYNISAEFLRKLAEIASEDPAKARNVLEYAAGQEERVFEPEKIFQDKDALAFSSKTDIPHYCAYSRKVTITPSTIYFSSPTVETTNRVLRRYSRENQDGRFLRVQFTDELAEVCVLDLILMT
jgi:RNA-dependent RNA polymerase